MPTDSSTPSIQQHPFSPHPVTVRVAAIDCGTNSIRLLIADVTPAGSAMMSGSTEGATPSPVRARIRDVVREMRIVRLGQGVDATGNFVPEALERTFRACREYAQLISYYKPQAVRFIATSATRDAQNRSEFIAGIEDILGVRPEVISGEEEASLSFAGAVSALSATDIASLQDSSAPQTLVMDIGGGSTEFVVGNAVGGAAEVAAAISMDIGCVRLTERHLHSDPPLYTECIAAKSTIADELRSAASRIDFSTVEAVIGVAGTVTTMTAAILGLDEYDSTRIHGSSYTADEVHTACEAMFQLPREERAQLGYMHPGRIDVIGGGALIFSEAISYIFDHFQSKALSDRGTNHVPRLLTSEADILDGTVLALATALDAPSTAEPVHRNNPM